MDNHSEKLRQEKRVNLLEATEKHMKTNAFDPLSQRTLGSEGGGCHVLKGALSLRFVDPLVEERYQSTDHAREVEIHMRGEAKFPPSYKGRETAAYGILGHR